ncbi:hypothetical protein L0F63_000708, partial [Massospora cicadina]
MGRKCCEEKRLRELQEALERENRRKNKVVLPAFRVGRPSDEIKVTYIPPDQTVSSKL